MQLAMECIGIDRTLFDSFEYTFLAIEAEERVGVLKSESGKGIDTMLTLNIYNNAAEVKKKVLNHR